MWLIVMIVDFKWLFISAAVSAAELLYTNPTSVGFPVLGILMVNIPSMRTYRLAKRRAHRVREPHTIRTPSFLI